MSSGKQRYRIRPEPEPDLLDFVPKNVWREVYQGRWAQLTKVQRSKFVIDVVFWAVFIGGFFYLAYARPGNSFTMLMVYAAVAAILLACFWALTRFIR